MEWINAVVIIGVLVMALHQRRRVMALEKTSASQKEQLASQADILASHKEILASQRAVLASYRDLAGVTKPHDSGLREQAPAQAVQIAEHDIIQRKRQEMAQEKSKFEKEVQARTKTMEWYEKEFSIGLDALLELFLCVPVRVRESIISKMPPSVMKKGFKRLSDTEYRA